MELSAQSEAVVTVASCCSEPVFAVCVPTSPKTNNIGRLECEHGTLANCKYTCKTDGVKKVIPH